MKEEKKTFNERCTICIAYRKSCFTMPNHIVNTFAKEIHFVVCTYMFVYKIATSNHGSVDFYEKKRKFNRMLLLSVYFNKRSVNTMYTCCTPHAHNVKMKNEK